MPKKKRTDEERMDWLAQHLASYAVWGGKFEFGVDRRLTEAKWDLRKLVDEVIEGK